LGAGRSAVVPYSPGFAPDADWLGPLTLVRILTRNKQATATSRCAAS
jgi:hypothetical protein